MIDVILIILTLAALLIASYSDLQIREVPDWLSYGLIAAALGIRLTAIPFLGGKVFWSGLLGLAFCFGLAYLFYYTDQWGGGDSKLLMGMGAVIGLPWPLSLVNLQLLWFFIALLLFGAIYGLLWMAYLAIRRRQQFIPACIITLKGSTNLHFTMWSVAVVVGLLSVWQPLLWIIVLFIISIFYLYIFITSVEQSCFFRKIPVQNLTEGDWLAEDVVVSGKTMVSKKTLEQDDLQRLRGLQRQGKLSAVLIKEGIPFVPSFLFAYLFVTIAPAISAWPLRMVLGV